MLGCNQKKKNKNLVCRILLRAGNGGGTDGKGGGSPFWLAGCNCGSKLLGPLDWPALIQQTKMRKTNGENARLHV